MQDDLIEKLLPVIIGIIVFAALMPIAMSFLSEAMASMGDYGSILVIVPIAVACGLVYSVIDIFKKRG